MIERKVIIENIVGFINTKIGELSSTNPLVLILRPAIARAVNNNVAKLDSFLKIIQDEKGMVDIEGIIDETIDNLLIAQIKKYPDVLGGVEIGNGTIKLSLPLINKAIELDTDDIKEFKNALTTK